MIEKKSFFTENNHLNKGYKAEGKSSSIAKRAAKIELPEASIIAAYEEMSPGTIAKMMEMTKKEQEHRHTIETLQLRMQKTALRVGRIFGIFAVAAICYTSFSLYLHDLTMQASVFAIIGFVALAIPACIAKCKSAKYLACLESTSPDVIGTRSKFDKKNSHQHATTSKVSDLQNSEPRTSQHFRRRKR
jgi:uncharacterized membrane protein